MLGLKKLSDYSNSVRDTRSDHTATIDLRFNKTYLLKAYLKSFIPSIVLLISKSSKLDVRNLKSIRNHNLISDY